MLRDLSPADRPQIEAWISAEPTHESNTWDWYNETGTKSVVVEDDAGAILVAKFTPCLRMDTDFSSSSPERIKQAITDGLREMEAQAKAQGFHEIVFESSSPGLIAFCRKLGYKESSSFRKVL